MRTVVSTLFFIALLLSPSKYLHAQLADDPLGKQNSASNNNTQQRAIFENQSKELQKLPQNATGLPAGASYQNNYRKGILLPGETDISNLLPLPMAGLAPPYGANIFAGGYETERSDGLNSDYIIASGDKISIWLWGTISYSDVTTVDNQGNIFVPSIGPIHVADVKASQVNKLVTSKIKTIYKKNVNVYVNLLTSTPVSIFIAGSAIRPGQYAGMASDSILYFLKRAGGIDSERGSYRNIKIIRNDEILHEIDLYQFIRFGKLPKINFKDNDVIFVDEQNSVINVAGGVKNPFRFEFKKGIITGSELISYVKPLTNTSHVAVSGRRNDGLFSVYLAMDDFHTFNLRNGDNLYFNDDEHAQIYDIEIVGSYLGPSYFAVSKSTSLHDLLSYIPIEQKLADYSSIYILRKSAAAEQKEILERTLDRLERAVFMAPTSSTGEAQIRSIEAKLIADFIERSRSVQPLGKVIVSDKGIVANIALEQGDKVVIPAKTDLIQVGGEVLVPQAIVYNKNATIEDYIAWAGGYSNRANYENVVIIHANGLSEFRQTAHSNTWLSNSQNNKLLPGDKVIVIPKVEAKTLQAIKDMTQIIYQIAIAANVVK